MRVQKAKQKQKNQAHQDIINNNLKTPMHTPLLSVSLCLISLASGMFLLGKTNKDNLSLFFRVISYFIIVVSFLTLACTAMQGAMHAYGRAHCHRMKYERSMGGQMGGMYDRMMSCPMGS